MYSGSGAKLSPPTAASRRQSFLTGGGRRTRSFLARGGHRTAEHRVASHGGGACLLPEMGTQQSAPAAGDAGERDGCERWGRSGPRRLPEMGTCATAARDGAERSSPASEMDCGCSAFRVGECVDQEDLVSVAGSNGFPAPHRTAADPGDPTERSPGGRLALSKKQVLSDLGPASSIWYIATLSSYVPSLLSARNPRSQTIPLSDLSSVSPPKYGYA